MPKWKQELIDSLAAKLFPFQESEEEQESFTDTGRQRVSEWIDEVLLCPACKRPRTCRFCKIRPAESLS